MKSVPFISHITGDPCWRHVLGHCMDVSHCVIISWFSDSFLSLKRLDVSTNQRPVLAILTNQRLDVSVHLTWHHQYRPRSDCAAPRCYDDKIGTNFERMSRPFITQHRSIKWSPRSRSEMPRLLRARGAVKILKFYRFLNFQTLDTVLTRFSSKC